MQLEEAQGPLWHLQAETEGIPERSSEFRLGPEGTGAFAAKVAWTAEEPNCESGGELARCRDKYPASESYSGATAKKIHSETGSSLEDGAKAAAIGPFNQRHGHGKQVSNKQHRGQHGYTDDATVAEEQVADAGFQSWTFRHGPPESKQPNQWHAKSDWHGYT